MVNHTGSIKRFEIKNKPIVIGLYVLAICLATFLVIWFNLSWRPDLTRLPPDSGFYAYIGKAILNGQPLYVGVWDDKPPLGYYLNALAQLIFGQTPWGVWWSSVVWVLGCTVLLFLVFKKLFGAVTAGIVSVIFIVALMNRQIFQGGNLMENYALAPQIGIVAVTYLYFTHQRKPWYAILVGILTACAFLIKQPTIILGCSSIFIILVSSLNEWKVRETIRSGLAFVLGFVGLLALASIYWLSIGSLDKFIEGLFLQGFSFIGGTGNSLRENFFYALVNVIPKLYIGKLFVLALFIGGFFLLEKLFRFWIQPVLKAGISLVGWFYLIVFVFFPLVGHLILPSFSFIKFCLISIFALGIFFLVSFHRISPEPMRQQVFSPVEWTWLIGLISLPLEVLMASLGGRYFGHYFVTMVPATMLVIAFPVWKVASATPQTLKSKGLLLQNAVYLILALGTLAWGAVSLVRELPSPTYRSDLAGIFSGQILENDLDRYIIQTTQPEDEVLIWHIHTGINFITDRRAPSRFLFPLNLFIPPDARNERLKEYVDDLEKQPPELIVVQNPSSLSLPFVDEPVDQLCKAYCTPEFVQAMAVAQIHQQWLRFQQFFESHYALDTKIYDWKIYRRLP